MKKILLAGVALAAIVAAAPASAADMPTRAPLYKAAPAPVFNWTGFYFGGHVGYGWGETDPNTAIEPSGIFGGVQLGYNWQMSPNWVFGLETDISGTDINDSAAGINVHVDWFGTTRARLGYAWDRTMLYGTGGIAYGRGSVAGLHNTHVGYAVGGGLEWAFAPGWSSKIEYLYVGLSDENYFGANLGLDLHTIKLGVNYRF